MAAVDQLKGALAKKQAQQPGRAPVDEAMTEEEEAALGAGLDEATKILYENEQASEQIAKLIQQKPFHQGVGSAAAMLTIQADKAVDGELPETVVIPLGAQVLELVADMGEELGFFKADDKLMARAAQAMLKDLYAEYGMNEDEVRGLAATAGDEEANALKQQGQFNEEDPDPVAGPEAPPAAGAPPTGAPAQPGVAA